MSESSLARLSRAPAPKVAEYLERQPAYGDAAIDALIGSREPRLRDFAWLASDLRDALLAGADPDQLRFDGYAGVLNLDEERPLPPLPSLAFAESCAGCGRPLPRRRMIALSLLLLNVGPPPRQRVVDLCLTCAGRHKQGASPRACLLRQIWSRDTETRR